MYPEIFYSNTFTLLAEARSWKTFLLEYCWFLVHGQVLLVIWFVVLILLVFFQVLLMLIESTWLAKLYGSGS
jgi:hypothetical protein